MDSTQSSKSNKCQKNASNELTLQDLTKIALGAPELTNVNIAALQSLLEMLLKKLNCQNEKVTLDECISNELNQILAQSQVSPLPFNDSALSNISSKVESIDKLEERINKLDSTLKKHLQTIQPCKNKIGNQKDNQSINTDEWDTYGCEEVCTLCLDNFGHQVACHFLTHNDLLRNLLRRISKPMVDRIIYFEEKVNSLSSAFSKFINKVEETNLKLTLIHTCIEEMEQLRIKMNENHSQFLSTMEEVQDMLDAKVDKLHMPALKQYFQERFRNLERTFRALEEKKHCPRVSGFISTGLRCVSCGSKNVGTNVENELIKLFPEVYINSKPKLRRKDCVCKKKFLANNENLLTAPAHIYFNKTIKFKKPPVNKNPDVCPKSSTKFNFIEGTNGQYFRKG